MKPNLFHTQFFRLFFLILLAGISIQTYAAKDSQAAPKKRTITGTVISEGDNEYSGSCDRKPKRYQCDSKV